jgi:protein ImuA
MPNQPSDIIKKLENEILPLQGYRSSLGTLPIRVDLGPVNEAFPNAQFPTGAIHEFVTTDIETQAAASGFIAGIIAALMQNSGVVLWISASRTIFPPALKAFNIDPGRVIFVDLNNQKEVAWALDEALKLNGLAAVVGEMQDINFTASRRFQLAVEQSQVTGFLFNRKNMSASNACLTRWRISARASVVEGDLPGVGFPAWKVELLKVRNGRPGSWDITWMNGQFMAIAAEPLVINELRRKTG